MIRRIHSCGFLGYIPVLLILIFSSSCDSNNQASSFDYGTKNDSARFYYLNGFHEILDNGRWTEAEISYRRALEFDPNYPLGKTLVGRITRDLEEREKLLQEVLAIKENINKDETLLFEVYVLSMEAYNNRDKGINGTTEFNARRRLIAEFNFRNFIKKYPKDDYVKAEYIELLHSIHGPGVALDSLKYLANQEQMNLGFYISYSASLELELGNLTEAIALSKKLEELMVDSTYTSYLKLKAEIYMAQDSLKKAQEYVNQIVQIDPNHLIALGMQSKIEGQLENSN